EQRGAGRLLSRAPGCRQGRAGAAPMECGRTKPPGTLQTAEPIWNHGLAYEPGVSRAAHAGRVAARRLSRFEQPGPHHTCRTAIRHRRARLPGLAPATGVRT